jgi:large subunit ribosomal protein L4
LIEGVGTMINIKIYNTSGNEVGNMELSDTVFGQAYNEPLIHQVIVAQLANKRQGTKSALTRAEVRGGGIKPWRQKGTGRARQGSIRAPQWIKGGVVFAPKPRDFSQKLNKRVKIAAIKSALSTKVGANEFLVVDDIKIAAPKTKEVQTILDSLKLDKRTLIVIDGERNDFITASRNIPNVKTINVDLLNVYDLVACNKCLITEAAVKKIEEVYAE